MIDPFGVHHPFGAPHGVPVREDVLSLQSLGEGDGGMSNLTVGCVATGVCGATWGCGGTGWCGSTSSCGTTLVCEDPTPKLPAPSSS